MSDPGRYLLRIRVPKPCDSVTGLLYICSLIFHKNPVTPHFMYVKKLVVLAAVS